MEPCVYQRMRLMHSSFQQMIFLLVQKQMGTAGGAQTRHNQDGEHRISRSDWESDSVYRTWNSSQSHAKRPIISLFHGPITRFGIDRFLNRGSKSGPQIQRPLWQVSWSSPNPSSPCCSRSTSYGNRGWRIPFHRPT